MRFWFLNLKIELFERGLPTLILRVLQMRFKVLMRIECGDVKKVRLVCENVSSRASRWMWSLCTTLFQIIGSETRLGSRPSFNIGELHF